MPKNLLKTVFLHIYMILFTFFYNFCSCDLMSGVQIAPSKDMLIFFYGKAFNIQNNVSAKPLPKDAT